MTPRFTHLTKLAFTALLTSTLASPTYAEVGDPQIRTDHPWYPGELAISNFDRLFATQAKLYRRVTGRDVESDEDKALASWLWRNTHYWHAEAGGRDLWGEGPARGPDRRLREYWSGLFAYGFGLCGTTHSQWSAEFAPLLGHGRGRGVGVAGHNAFEVLLTGGPYGDSGRWALLDHDLSTVIFDRDGKRLLGLAEIRPDVDRLTDRTFLPDRQRGWLVCGLYPGDGVSYQSYNVAEYLPGYAGPPPITRLRRGERMRRYFEPGLEDGETFVFWGRNYNNGGIPGPERSRTWVNQPDAMHGSQTGTPHRTGQVRYANVEYVYRPDFNSGDYREGIVRETDSEVVFEFHSPYVIAATPPNDEPWGIYDDGCRNGLVIRGNADCDVAVSLDAGRTWSQPQPLDGQLDLTDLAKGRGHYQIRLTESPRRLRDSGLEIRTVCQANVAVLPRLRDNGTRIDYEASGKSVRPFGPEAPLAKSTVTEGGFGESTVTMAASASRPVVAVYAAGHVASGNPPDPEINYAIELSSAADDRWEPIVDDWSVPRRGDEPDDFWSQSFCYGTVETEIPAGETIRVRFRNDGRKRYLRTEMHLVEQSPETDPLRVTYAWTDSEGNRSASHRFDNSKPTWHLDTATDVRTRWVEFQPEPNADESSDTNRSPEANPASQNR